MIALERRWARDVLSGFAALGEADGDGDDPQATSTGPRLVPQPGEVNYLEAYEGMLFNGSFLSGIGMRLALSFAALSPLWVTGRFKRFGSLPASDRAALLERLLHHPVFLIAELTLLLKLCACMALFRSPSLRERSNYDLPESDAPADAPAPEVVPDPPPGARRLPVVQQAEMSK